MLADLGDRVDRNPVAYRPTGSCDSHWWLRLHDISRGSFLVDRVHKTRLSLVAVSITFRYRFPFFHFTLILYTLIRIRTTSLSYNDPPLPSRFSLPRPQLGSPLHHLRLQLELVRTRCSRSIQLELWQTGQQLDVLQRYVLGIPIPIYAPSHRPHQARTSPL